MQQWIMMHSYILAVVLTLIAPVIAWAADGWVMWVKMYGGLSEPRWIADDTFDSKAACLAGPQRAAVISLRSNGAGPVGVNPQ